MSYDRTSKQTDIQAAEIIPGEYHAILYDKRICGVIQIYVNP